jgi:hypothetical protein
MADLAKRSLLAHCCLAVGRWGAACVAAQLIAYSMALLRVFAME